MKCALAVAFALALALAAPALAGDKVVKASADSRLEELFYIFGIHNLSDDKSHVAVRLFESGGGDPALNGNHLLLAIVPSPDQAPRIWRTGIDIYLVRSVSLDAQKSEIAIEVTEHFPGDAGDVDARPRLYTIQYDVDPKSGVVSENIRVRGNQP